MRRPRHVALGCWRLRPANPRSQALRPVERPRLTHQLPLALSVSESVADLDLHRAERASVDEAAAAEVSPGRSDLEPWAWLAADVISHPCGSLNHLVRP